MLSRLITLQSRIDATEELILLELGHRRNEIVSFTLVRRLLSELCEPVTTMPARLQDA